ncbi:MAG TPA: ABC transporter, partial [Oscillospiraceae bacterium]|nr:ABC transporter [Oscillospiraceae bacterium]
ILAVYLAASDRFAGLFAKVMGALSLYERFYGFVDGVFDFTAVVYYLTVIGVCLFLTVQSMEKRRWN